MLVVHSILLNIKRQRQQQQYEIKQRKCGKIKVWLGIEYTKIKYECLPILKRIISIVK